MLVSTFDPLEPRSQEELRDFLKDFDAQIEEMLPFEIEVFLKHCKSYQDIEDRLTRIDDFPELIADLRQAAKEAGADAKYGEEAEG